MLAFKNLSFQKSDHIQMLEVSFSPFLYPIPFFPSKDVTVILKSVLFYFPSCFFFRQSRGLGRVGLRRKDEGRVPLPISEKLPKGQRRAHLPPPQAAANHSNRPRQEVPGARDWLSRTSAPGRGRPPRSSRVSRPHAGAAGPAPLVRMRAVPRGKSLRTPPPGLRLAPRLPPLSAEACRLGETARAAAGRGLCGPKAAAVAPACGKCHQAALRFVARVTAVPRPPIPEPPATAGEEPARAVSTAPRRFGGNEADGRLCRLRP